MKTIIASSLTILSFTLTLFVFAPSHIYLTNISEFSILYPDLLTNLLLLSAGAFLVLLFMVMLLQITPSLQRRVVALLFSLSVMLFLQGHFLVWDYGLLDGREIHWKEHLGQGIVDGAIWLVVVSFSLWKSEKVFVISRKASGAIVLLQLVAIIFYASRTPEMPSFKKYVIDESGKFTFSKNQNVIIFVLDTFQTDVFQEIINQDGSYKKVFDGFTYFRNALAGHPFTETSTMNILTGQFYEGAKSFEKHNQIAYSSNSLPKVLKTEGFQVDLYPAMKRSIFYDESIASNFRRGKIAAGQIRQEMVYLLDTSLFRYLPTILKTRVYNGQRWLFQRKPQLLRHLIRDEPAESYSVPRSQVSSRYSFSNEALFHCWSLHFINQMLTLATANQDWNIFKYYHLDLPHAPLRINEALQYEEMDATRENFVRQSVAALKITELFLEELKRIDAYHHSLIFIIGDHGAGAQHQRFIPQPGFPVANGQSVVTLPRMINALPLFLVKRFGARGPLKSSNAPVSLADIPSTVFSEVGIQVNSPGMSIFNIGETDSRERRFIAYGKYDVEDDQYRALEEWVVDGYGWQLDSWQPSHRSFKTKGVISNPARTYTLGKPIRFGKNQNGLSYLGYGWKHMRDSTWTQGTRASLIIPVTPVNSDIALSALIVPNLVNGKFAKRRVVVYAGEEKIGFWDVSAEGPYTLIMPRKTMREKSLKIILEMPDAVPSPEVSDGTEFAVTFQRLTLAAIPAYKFGTVIDLRQNQDWVHYATNGWTTRGTNYLSIAGSAADFTVPIDLPGGDLVLKADIKPVFTGTRILQQPVNIFINETRTGMWRVAKIGEYQITIPKKLVSTTVLRIRFELPGAGSRIIFREMVLLDQAGSS